MDLVKLADDLRRAHIFAVAASARVDELEDEAERAGLAASDAWAAYRRAEAEMVKAAKA